MTAEMLLDGDNTFPDGPDSLASSTLVTEVSDFWDNGPEDDCPEDCLAAAILGDTDTFWGVAASPSPASQGMQGLRRQTCTPGCR